MDINSITLRIASIFLPACLFFTSSVLYRFRHSPLLHRLLIVVGMNFGIIAIAVVSSVILLPYIASIVIGILLFSIIVISGVMIYGLLAEIFWLGILGVPYSETFVQNLLTTQLAKDKSNVLAKELLLEWQQPASKSVYTPALVSLIIAISITTFFV